MTNIDRNYVAYALGWLIIGTLFGFWMGASNTSQYVSVHVAMLLPGFVTLAIYGMIYRLWPGLKASPFAAAQFWLAVASLPLLVLGAWLLARNGSMALVAIASGLAIVSALLMGLIFWRGAA